MSKNPNILIVGAGAGGLVTGYHLSVAGADVTFYVRPKRLKTLQPPASLYCYDNCKLIKFVDYQLTSDMNEVAKRDYDFVLVTLDGYAAMSEEGTKLIADLGKAVEHSKAIIFNMGVSVGIREHYEKHSGLPGHRILNGSFMFLSHQVPLKDQPMHKPIDPAELSKASMAYTHMFGNTGVIVDNRYPVTAKKFAEIYNRCQISRCKIVNKDIMALTFNIVFPFLAACELAGWPPTKEMVRDKTWWPMACKAANEIAALPSFGRIGKVTSRIMIAPMWRMLWQKMDKGSMPLDYNAFNRFHHGGKVVEQDTMSLRQNLKRGEGAGIPMPNLRALISQLDERRITQ